MQVYPKTKTSFHPSLHGAAAPELYPIPDRSEPLPLSAFPRTTPASAPLSVSSLRLRTHHLLTGCELSAHEIHALVELAVLLKKNRSLRREAGFLSGHQLALIFEKPSLRTRVSFTAAMNDLGGQTIEIASQNTKKEDPEDTARVLAGYCHAIGIRTFAQSTLTRMAKVSPVPIINMLSDEHHPCQTLADLMTLRERYGTLNGVTLTYIGDGNNILNSLLLMAPQLGVRIHYACPAGYGPKRSVLAEAKMRVGPKHKHLIQGFKDPRDAVQGAHALYTDVWTSMGFEQENEKRLKAFQGFQLNEALHALAAPGAAIMHCMPMVRGQEISENLPEHECSVLFQQSENRMHVQKALLLGLLPQERITTSP